MTIKQHAKKAGVDEKTLKDALTIEKTMASSPMYLKWNSIQITAGCTEEEAKKALSYVWDYLGVETN